MSAAHRVRVLVAGLGVVALALPLSSHADKTAVVTERPKAHAISLLNEAAALIGQLPPAKRSPALNSLAEAWIPIAPAEARRILNESFVTASSLTPEEKGPQQADVVRRMAAIDLPAARELAVQIRPAGGEDYTIETDWRAMAWDGLLQESLARGGLDKAVEQAKKMSDGLADTFALSLLVRIAVRQNPQAARDLVAQAAQQFQRRPITIRRFETFPKALVVIAAIDRGMAQRLFDSLISYIPERPSGGDADAERGKQQIAFIREASTLLLRRAERFDPVLAQEWVKRLDAGSFSEDTEANDGSVAAEQDGNSQSSVDEDRRHSAGVVASVNLMQDQDLQAQTRVRLAQRLSRGNPAMAKDLLGAGRTEAATIADPVLRASLYTKAARAGDLLHDPHVNDDLEAAEAALSLAQRTAKDEETRDNITAGEMNVMQRIIQRLDAKSAEIRAQQFTNPVVRFRALILVAQRWASTEDLNQPHHRGKSAR